LVRAVNRFSKVCVNYLKFGLTEHTNSQVKIFSEY
jgi:hypothetical protein